MTLKNDLKRIESYMKTFVLELNTDNLKVLGDERNIRRILLDILLKNYNLHYVSGGKVKIKKNYQYGFLSVGIKWTNIFQKNRLIKL